MAELATTVDAPSAGATLLDKKMKKHLPSWVSGTIVAVALIGGLIGGMGYIDYHLPAIWAAPSPAAPWAYSPAWHQHSCLACCLHCSG